MSNTRLRPTLPPLHPDDRHQVFTAGEMAQRLKMGRSTFDKAWHRGELPGPDIRRGAKYVRWSYAAMTAALEQLVGVPAAAAASK